VLENATVRAAAVASLAKFGIIDDTKLKKSVGVLLNRQVVYFLRANGFANGTGEAV
jgi:hypothetical protein